MTRKAARQARLPAGRVDGAANTYAAEEARFWSGRTGDGASLIRLDHDLVGAIDPLDPRRTISERRINAGLPEIGRFEELVM